jgi:hypothetical protein
MIAGSAQKAARCDRICAHLVIKVRLGVPLPVDGGWSAA